jgi:hypothetical protein
MLDCEYDEEDPYEKTAFAYAFTNILVSARDKTPYNPQSASAAAPQNVKLEEEK